jgi:hypothetical protein
VTTVDFEALAPGALLPSGSAVDGITLSYDLFGETAVVTDAFSAVSSTNMLGLDNADLAFFDGDAIAFSFSGSSSFGLFVVTSDPALEGEILLSAGGGETIANAADPFAILADGGLAYFLGLTSATTFSSASLGFLDDGEVNFVYNVDDIRVGAPVPEPSAALVFGLGLLVVRRRLRGRAE